MEGAAATATAIAIAIGGACSRCGRGCGEPDKPIDPQSTLRGEGGLFFHLWSTHRRVSMGLWARHAACIWAVGEANRTSRDEDVDPLNVEEVEGRGRMHMMIRGWRSACDVGERCAHEAGVREANCDAMGVLGGDRGVDVSGWLARRGHIP